MITAHKIFVAIVLFLFSLILIAGCSTPTESNIRVIDKCDDNLSELSCDELLDCYDRCSKITTIIHHQQNCREKLNARLWKCYGVEK